MIIKIKFIKHIELIMKWIWNTGIKNKEIDFIDIKIGHENIIVYEYNKSTFIWYLYEIDNITVL